MTINSLVSVVGMQNPIVDISAILNLLHRQGPYDSAILEQLALYKRFHRQAFSELEEQIISALGLFYKIHEPISLYSLLLSTIGNTHQRLYGELLTPVQASVRRAIDDHQYVSISAPTSAGKSYSIRDFIADDGGDAVIIVPSRALIAEYLNSMRRRFSGNKSVMISPFVDSVFSKRKLRRIFVLTPERARELFILRLPLNIKVFFFDEAQVSEERIRGVFFDVLVRRVKKHFPRAKLIFAHPFVDNPDAQFKKHSIPFKEGYARSYPHGAVGKISIYHHKNGTDRIFSPFEKNGHLLKNSLELDFSFEDFAFSHGHAILIFVSKASIYNGSFLTPFVERIASFEPIQNPRALTLIAAVSDILGADDNDHHSNLVELLKKGVVVHHGSVPLEVRFIIEDYIRAGFARICFATSTLAQGVNMPFDIVWLRSMRIMGENESERSLSFKNLIGRAGRLSAKAEFDYGYVYTDNPKLYSERINGQYTLNETSAIDLPYDDLPPETREIIDAIRSDTFDDDLNIPFTKMERLSTDDVIRCCKTIVEIIYSEDLHPKQLSGTDNHRLRIELRENFKKIFSAAINRELTHGERVVFDTAMMIFTLSIGGKSFKEIAGIRYSNISRRNEGRAGLAAFSQGAHHLPDSSLEKPFPLFKDVLAKDVSYDAVVFDTYDYIDQVISFSLSDTFIAAFKIYKVKSGDSGADRVINLLRYRTNDQGQIMLMRYGLPPDSVGEIAAYIKQIDEEDIKFSPLIHEAPDHIRNLVDWYMP